MERIETNIKIYKERRTKNFTVIHKTWKTNDTSSSSTYINNATDLAEFFNRSYVDTEFKNSITALIAEIFQDPQYAEEEIFINYHGVCFDYAITKTRIEWYSIETSIK